MRSALRTWYVWHKWSSLVCTVFLLVICLTGLPLIFEQELNGWLAQDAPYPVMPASTPRINLDRIVANGRAAFPGEVPRSLYFKDNEPALVLSLAPSVESGPETEHWVKYDVRTGTERRREQPGHPIEFMQVMLDLHTDLFAGLPGELFMGGMALCFLISIVTGIVLYAPFMRRVSFGTVRLQRSKRLKWLDLHNLLSAATLLWLVVLGFTGLVNELATPLFTLWQATDVQRALGSFKGQALPTEMSSVQAAFETASAAVPHKEIVSVVYPTHGFGSPRHFVFWSRGDSVLTSRMFTPVLIDAVSGQSAGALQLPWYLKALEVCRPLHFGDYGGLPLKVLWSIFDVAAIVVLGSGLYLWWARRKSVDARITQIERAHMVHAS